MAAIEFRRIVCNPLLAETSTVQAKRLNAIRSRNGWSDIYQQVQPLGSEAVLLPFNASGDASDCRLLR